jgi:autotransporter-associated beta strand protein
MSVISQSSEIRGLVLTSLLGMLASHASAGTIYFDDFNDQQNINAGGPYTQTLGGSAPTTRNAIFGGSTTATWLAGVETGGHGQRDLNDSNVATPTSSNFLPFTPDASQDYTVEATIDTTPLAGADPGGTSSWFALGFTSSQHNWNGADSATIDTGNVVRFNSNQVATITYTVSGADLVAAGVQYVGWITDHAGAVNLSGAAQVKIDNFKLTSIAGTRSLFYNGNGNTAGSAPVDLGSPYTGGTNVTVLGNTGGLEKPAFVFSGWNTATDGSGTTYQPGGLITISSNTTLHARWTDAPDVVWDNGSGSRNWNSTDANWSGPAWNNSRWDSAVFGSTGIGTVKLTEAIIARAITFNAPGYVLNGGSLSLTGPQTITCNANATINSSFDSSALNKAGSGTLTLGGSTSYLGSVAVNGGRITLSNPLLDGCTTVSIAAGAGMDLNFNGSNAIAALTIAGNSLPVGTYNAQHPVYGSYFSGPGSLRIHPMTWQLAGGHEGWPAGMRATLVNSMNEAVAVHNAYGYFPMQCTANYSAGVPTAQAGYGGWIDFGGSTSPFTAIHEIQHSLGVGTYWAWPYQFSNGQWIGTHTAQRIQLYEGASTSVGGDGAHFWPYGMNFASEDGLTARERHVKLVAAMRWDMGIVVDSDNDGMPDDWEMFHFENLNQSATGDPDNDGQNNSLEYQNDSNPNLSAVISGLVLSDTFESASYGAGTFNHSLAADQQGHLAPLAYSPATAGQDWHAQHGNGGAMLLVGDAGYAARSSLNQNFATLANTADLPLTIQMDAWVTDTTNLSCWASITLGSGQNLIANDIGAKFAILPEVGGGLQVILNGSQQILASRSGNNFRIVFSDTAGTGSPFNGKGSRALLYNGTTLVGTYTLSQLTAADGYLSFAACPYNGSWNITRIDNLSVTLASIAISPSDYDAWKTANEVIGATNDDDDQDGQSNFMEYAFGLDPTNPSSLQPIIGNPTPTGILGYTRRKTALTGLTYTVWTSADLSTWNADGEAVQSVIGVAGDIETVQFTLSAPAPEISRLFIRISAQ